MYLATVKRILHSPGGWWKLPLGCILALGLGLGWGTIISLPVLLFGKHVLTIAAVITLAAVSMFLPRGQVPYLMRVFMWLTHWLAGL